MIGEEDDLEGGEDNKRGRSQKPRKGKIEISDRDKFGSLRNMMINAESQKCMTAVVEGIKIGDHVSDNRAGFRNEGELQELQFRSRRYGLKILQGKNVLHDSLGF